MNDRINYIKCSFYLIIFSYRLAPEFPYPTPLNDCVRATEHFLDNIDHYDIKLDLKNFAICGDSAGALISINISNILLSKGKFRPKCQGLIYPPTQYFDFKLPSQIKYGLYDGSFSRAKFALWHLGIKNVNRIQEEILIKNVHQSILVKNKKLFEKYSRYLDVGRIPEKYKKNKVYYDCHQTEKDKENMNKKVQEYISKNPEYVEKIAHLLEPNLSPCLADDKWLRNQPNSFIIACEMDSRKDEGLLFAERLKSVEVPVQVELYEQAFHGDVTNKKCAAQKMKIDLLDFIRQNLKRNNLLKISN